MKVSHLYKQGELLRKQGFSFREIHETLGISKSTASLWYRNIILNDKAKERLVAVSDNGRAKAFETLNRKRSAKRQEILDKASSTVNKIVFTPEIMQLIVALLYWAEGAKSSNGAYFTNSDPVMMKVYMTLIRKVFNTKPESWYATLHLHEYHDVEKQKDYWSNVTGISKDKINTYKKPHTGINKRPNYPGCIQVRYSNMDLFRYIQGLYNTLAHNMGA